MCVCIHAQIHTHTHTLPLTHVKDIFMQGMEVYMHPLFSSPHAPIFPLQGVHVTKAVLWSQDSQTNVQFENLWVDGKPRRSGLLTLSVSLPGTE